MEEQAKEIYGKLLGHLDAMGWKYEKDEEKLVVRSGVKIRDFSVLFVLVVKERNGVVQMLARLPFTVPDDTQWDIVMSVAVANFGLIDGSFDYDFKGKSIFFRISECYRDCTVGDGLFDYMIRTAASTIEHYCPKFKDISDGKLTFEALMDEEKK